MNRPDPADLNEILDACLLRLQTGESIDSVLADYPALNTDLRPALETVMALWTVRGSDTVPAAAMARSRERLLKATHRLNTVPRPSKWKVQWVLFSGSLSRFRPLAAPLVGLIVIACLLFTGLASAQALPGETFYPVKIAAEQIGLSFAGSPSDRLEREETYDLRRKEEVEALIFQNREEEVYFTGFLTHGAAGEWWIDEINVSMPTEMVAEAKLLENRYVYLHADLLPHGELRVEWIEPRVYFVTGRITAIEPEHLSVGDVRLRLDENSESPQILDLGQTVRASVTRLQGDTLVALKIEVIGPNPSPTPSRTALPIIQPSETPQPGDGANNNPPEEEKEPSDADKKDHSDDDEDDNDSDDNKDEQKDGEEKSPQESDDDDEPDSSAAENHQTITPESTPRKRR